MRRPLAAMQMEALVFCLRGAGPRAQGACKDRELKAAPVVRNSRHGCVRVGVPPYSFNPMWLAPDPALVMRKKVIDPALPKISRPESTVLGQDNRIREDIRGAPFPALQITNHELAAGEVVGAENLGAAA